VILLYEIRRIFQDYRVRKGRWMLGIVVIVAQGEGEGGEE
jgi:hypothetical protein